MKCKEGSMSAEFTMETFEAMAQQARKAEEKRVEAGVTVGNLDLEFAVATWLTDREEILRAIEIVLNKMLEVDGRSRGRLNRNSQPV